MNFINYYCKFFVVAIIFQINPIETFGRMYTSDAKNEYYIESEQKYIWVEALINCMEMNMSLVTIDTSSKSNEINRLVKTTFGRNIRLWVGGIMTRYPRNHFIWLSTGKQFTFSFWNGNNPDFEYNIENCLQIGWGNNMEWNDRSCNYQHGFVCEHNQQRLEQEKLKQILQQEIEKQQKIQETIKEKDKQEKILQQELDNVKNKLKQIEEKNLEEKIKLKKELLEESEKREKILQEEVENMNNTLKQREEQNLKMQEKEKQNNIMQQELENVKNILKQLKGKNLEIQEKETQVKLLKQELENVKSELKQIEDKNLEAEKKLKQEQLEKSEKREKLLQKELESMKSTLKQMEERNLEIQEKEKQNKILQQELQSTKKALKILEEQHLQARFNREVENYSQPLAEEKEEKNQENNVEDTKKNKLKLKLLSALNDKGYRDINVHFHQDHYLLNILNENFI